MSTPTGRIVFYLRKTGHCIIQQNLIPDRAIFSLIQSYKLKITSFLQDATHTLTESILIIHNPTHCPRFCLVWDQYDNENSADSEAGGKVILSLLIVQSGI